jgi:hypothetical protein
MVSLALKGIAVLFTLKVGIIGTIEQQEAEEEAEEGEEEQAVLLRLHTHRLWGWGNVECTGIAEEEAEEGEVEEAVLLRLHNHRLGGGGNVKCTGIAGSVEEMVVWTTEEEAEEDLGLTLGRTIHHD